MYNITNIKTWMTCKGSLYKNIVVTTMFFIQMCITFFRWIKRSSTLEAIMWPTATSHVIASTFANIHNSATATLPNTRIIEEFILHTSTHFKRNKKYLAKFIILLYIIILSLNEEQKSYVIIRKAASKC